VANFLFVGNDLGVWAMNTPRGKVQEKEKEKCIDVSANLPNAIITDLVYHAKSESLVASTYGRSLWWTSMAEIGKLAARKMRRTELR
jgi:hypothetical protein